MADAPVDPYPAMREACAAHCTTATNNYQACAERIKAKGTGDCEQWYFDLVKCIDRCAGPKVFKQLK